MGKNKFICEYCGKEFYDYFEVMRFCSKECFHASQKEKTKQICQYCGKEFNRKHSRQKFCSRECRNLSMRKRIECTCDNCGKEMSVPPNAYNNVNHHFCSKACKVEFFGWTDKEIQYLNDNYGIKSYTEMANELNGKSAKAISSKAIALGLTSSRDWSDEEEKIVKQYYSTISFEELQKMLPNRTESAIRRKAHSIGMFSKYALDSRINEEQVQFIKDNYLDMSDSKIAKELGILTSSVRRKRHNEKLYRPNENPTCYTALADMIRTSLWTWKNEVLKESNYTCRLTGKVGGDLVVHHKLSFNIIMNEAMDKIDFEVRTSIDDYSNEELELLKNTFFKLQEAYGEYVCINKDVHRLFHRIYGNGDNTPEQFDEFERDFKNGKYDDYIKINKR